MTPKPNVSMEEPPANMRAMARTFRDMYVALVKEGFTEKEALSIIGEMLQAAFIGGQQ